MTELSCKTCVPCRGDVPALEGAEPAGLHRQLPGKEHNSDTDETTSIESEYLEVVAVRE